jgi:hypothetical protein
VRECERAGVGVLWLSFDSGIHVRNVAGRKTQIISDNIDHVAAVAVIGAAAVKALTEASM